MSALGRAIRNEEWELASLYLLLGVVKAASALPPDAVEALIEALSGLEDQHPRRRRGSRRGRRR